MGFFFDEYMSFDFKWFKVKFSFGFENVFLIVIGSVFVKDSVVVFGFVRVEGVDMRGFFICSDLGFSSLKGDVVWKLNVDMFVNVRCFWIFFNIVCDICDFGFIGNFFIKLGVLFVELSLLIFNVEYGE